MGNFTIFRKREGVRPGARFHYQPGSYAFRWRSNAGRLHYQMEVPKHGVTHSTE